MAELGTVQGALQNLQEMYQQRYNPEESQRQMQARNQAVDQYQNLVDSPIPRPGFIDQLTNNYLSGYRPGFGTTSMLRSIGQTGNVMDEQQRADRSSAMKDQLGIANLRQNMIKEEDQVLKNQMSAVAKQVGGANKPTVKMDKDGNMVVYDPSTQETKIVHSSQRGEYQRVWQKAYQAAVDQGMESPEDYAHKTASSVLGTSPKSTTETQTAPKAPITPTVPGEAPVAQVQPGAPAANPVTTAAPLRYKDKAEEDRRKTFAVEQEKAALKDYDENIATPARAADSMLQTVGMLKQIPRTQDAFAEWREKVGKGFDAIGLDGNMAREAQNLQQVRPLLAKLANDRLLMAKGVQTEGDAQRAYNEFLKITDTQKAADFMMAWTEELAQRAKFKDDVYRKAAEVEGTMKKGKDWWESSDYAKAAPVALLNGKPYMFTKWRDDFIKANEGATVQDAVKAWNSLTSGKKNG